MFADTSKPPPVLPAPRLQTIRRGISLLPPLSRRGRGPGLIILTENSVDPLRISECVPSALVKWAEESFAVVQVEAAAFDGQVNGEVLKEAVEALDGCEDCNPKGKVGLVAYNSTLWNRAAGALDKVPSIISAIVYTQDSSLETLTSCQIPVARHVAASSAVRSPSKKASDAEYHYPKMQSHFFATPHHADFHYTTESLSHTRNLQFLKPKLGGPYFELEQIWEEHTYYEFAVRSVEHTMSTMVDQPYVNHVTTLTGGIGRDRLTSFYRDNFIFANSADTDLELVSRTVGIDRVVDEFIFKFTHDREIDWLLPRVPPTNLKVEVPFTAIINIRGDRLYHEHISWDQGTVLRQLGLLPEYLPFPHALPPGHASQSGASFEYRVPVAGAESAAKLRDRQSVPSNEMFDHEGRFVPKT